LNGIAFLFAAQACTGHVELGEGHAFLPVLKRFTPSGGVAGHQSITAKASAPPSQVGEAGTYDLQKHFIQAVLESADTAFFRTDEVGLAGMEQDDGITIPCGSRCRGRTNTAHGGSRYG
jgi:hypothetical protein